MGEILAERAAPVASIVIPAHNEEQAIGRLLSGLLKNARPDEFQILVLCNGCTDHTVDIASRYQPAVTVVDLPVPSKREALKHADELTEVFPRLYIDADVQIDTAGVRALVQALRGSVHAAAPTRVIPREGVSVAVRAYYDVWEMLPQVRTAPFGRGVVSLSHEGHQRVNALPALLADDLAMTKAFAAPERTVVTGAQVVIRPPRTLRDLLRRRVRIDTGNAQIDRTASPRSSELRTSVMDLARIGGANPALVPKLSIFFGVALTSRLSARRRVRAGDFTTWLRDDSSRD